MENKFIVCKTLCCRSASFCADLDPYPSFHFDGDPEFYTCWKIRIFLLLFTAVPVYIVFIILSGLGGQKFSFFWSGIVIPFLSKNISIKRLYRRIMQPNTQDVNTKVKFMRIRNQLKIRSRIRKDHSGPTTLF